MVDEQRLAALAKHGGGWVAQDNPHYQALVEAGLAEQTDGPDADGDIFVVLTEAGEKWLSASAKGEAPKLKLVEPEPVEAPLDFAQARAEGMEPVGDPLEALASAPEKATRANGAEKPAGAPRGRRGRVVTPEPEKKLEVSSLCPQVAAEWDVDDEPWNRPPPLKRFGKDRSPLWKALRLDELPVGASIHIAATPEEPLPHRKYAHYVVQTNRKYATEKRDPGGNVMLEMQRGKMRPALSYSRRYRIFKAAEGDPRGPGARIQRVDPGEWGGDE